MKFFSQYRGRIDAIVAAGLRYLLILLIIETVVLAISIGIGVWVGINHGILLGAITGILFFKISQGAVAFIFEMIFEFSDEPEVKVNLPSHREEIHRLRTELEAVDSGQVNDE